MATKQHRFARCVVGQRKTHAAAARILFRELEEHPEERPRLERWLGGWTVVRLGPKP